MQTHSEAACTLALVPLPRKYTPGFHGLSDGKRDEKCIAFFAGRCDIFRADNTQVYDRQGYIGRVLSSSYSLKEGDASFAEYLKEIGDIFDEFSENGSIAVPTATVAYSGIV